MKKYVNIVFTVIFMVVLSLPFLFAKHHSVLRDSYGKLNYNLFRVMERDDYYLGNNGNLNYLTADMLENYLHLNLPTQAELESQARNFQSVANWLKIQNIQFYYIQCYDKHSIYPEQVDKTLRPNGSISKTDAAIDYLQRNTTVNIICLKDALLNAKEQYDVYSYWGDPTHWTDRGAYIGYSQIMTEINKQNNGRFSILSEDAYNITHADVGITLNAVHVEDTQECFSIKTPTATQDDPTLLGQWKDDPYHSVWANPQVENDTTVLLVADSYFDGFILDDMAESFSKIYFVRSDYVSDLTQMVATFHPDIVMIGCTERTDCSSAISAVVNQISENQQ